MITESRYAEAPRNWIVYDGKPLKDYKLYCSGDKTFSSPQRDVETVTIPGKSGSYITNVNGYKNRSVQYGCWIASDFRNNIAALRNFLSSSTGYNRIEDTYDPDTFCLAAFQGPLDVSAALGSTFGSFTLTFDALPQRYLKTGEIVSTFTNGQSSMLYNPTLFDAHPYIITTGSGTLTVGSYSMTITGGGVTNIDTSVPNAWYGTTNKNQYVTCANRKWPTLVPGENRIVVSGFSKVEITPRWWML